MVVVYPGAQTLDVSGPLEVFDTVNRLLSDPQDTYRLQCVSPEAPLVATSAGLVVQAEPLEAGEGAIDTLLVPGGPGLKEALANPSLVAWIRRAAARSRRVASVCGGAFLLAEAGLLDGRRATTHWAVWEQMARRYPEVTVDPEPIFVWDGPYVTSAGVSTGIDMALALVESDHGAAYATEVAKFLVLYLKRPGGQTQFSMVLDAQLTDQEPIRAVQDWVQENLHRALPVPELACRARMSPRHFARVFRRAVGMTPGQYVRRMRIARARQLLEATDLSVGQIASRCGFTATETFLRAFGALVGLTPAQYRQHFQLHAPSGLLVEPAWAERRSA
ncbi:putative transcriptional regulator, AraC family protein [Streptomyces echinoruber]|uniref:Transcriptional regulator, AraC family protein n=1 Tax=Streptomyces echinoruber TaxID=68898 RepID=A0A918RNK4_9ACTN|nr:putative transcriptional regulator, AraC family protein [Streptomyces echinoruber]